MINLNSYFSTQIKKEKANITMYFSGSVNDCYTLKILLNNTEHNLSVYYFNQEKINKSDNLDKKTEHEKNIELLENYQKYREFKYEEIKLGNATISSYKDFSDSLLHIDVMQKESSNIIFSELDYYINTNSKSEFINPFKIHEIHNELKVRKLQEKYLIPFFSENQQDISAQAITKILDFADYNFAKIHNDNIKFIDNIPSLSNKKIDKKEIEKYLNLDLDFNIIYFYILATDEKRDNQVAYIENFGDQVYSSIYKYCLARWYLISFRISNLEIIKLSTDFAELKDKDFNDIIIEIIDYFAGYKGRTKQERIDEIDVFFKLYGEKITTATKNQLMHEAFCWVGWHNELLLNKLIELGADVGDLLIRSIDIFLDQVKRDKTNILIDQYIDKITPDKLDKALEVACEEKAYDICTALMKKGAKYNENTEKYRKLIEKSVKSSNIYSKISTKIKSDKKLLLEEVRKNPEIIFEVLKDNDQKFRNNDDFINKILSKREIYKFIYYNIFDQDLSNLDLDKNIALKFIEELNPRFIKTLSEELRDNIDIAFAAVSKDPYSMKYVSENMKNSYDLGLKLVKDSVDNIHCIESSLKQRIQRSSDVKFENIHMSLTDKDVQTFENLGYTKDKTYGEVPDNSVKYLLDHIDVETKDKTFVDLGSGRGRITLAIKKFYPELKKSVGIELSETRFHKSQDMLKHSSAKIRQNVEFFNKNFFDPMFDYTEFDIIFTNNLCFAKENNSEIGEKIMSSCKKGTYIFSTTELVNMKKYLVDQINVVSSWSMNSTISKYLIT
ncbi:DUF4116 domain-containing protein [Rickettsiales bacterium]|nr:DUF4116 domain-containing protein [Rickettsiales bacterium]